MGMKNTVADIRKYLNYDNVRKNIVYKLVNTERNRELLEDVPHMDFLDLSVVFQCVVSWDEGGYESIRIYNVHMRLWDVSVEDLYGAARENTPRIMPYEIKSMGEVLREIRDGEDPEQYGCDEGMDETANSVPMYVLSNKKRIDGAACMLYPDLIRDISGSIGSSLFIIPSSVHELLLLPADDVGEPAGIQEMIREMNNTQIHPDELLSYSLYYYDREEGKIRIY